MGGFFIFNLCDLLGRIMAGLTKWPGSSRSGSLVTFLMSLARLAFIPLLLFCNISPDNRHLTQVAFQSDAVFIALNVLFSLSNGYIVNICMMSGRLQQCNNIERNNTTQTTQYHTSCRTQENSV